MGSEVERIYLIDFLTLYFVCCLHLRYYIQCNFPVQSHVLEVK